MVVLKFFRLDASLRVTSSHLFTALPGLVFRSKIPDFPFGRFGRC